MSGKVWDADTLDAIADLVEGTGRTVNGPTDDDANDDGGAL